MVDKKLIPDDLFGVDASRRAAPAEKKTAKSKKAKALKKTTKKTISKPKARKKTAKPKKKTVKPKKVEPKKVKKTAAKKTKKTAVKKSPTKKSGKRREGLHRPGRKTRARKTEVGPTVKPERRATKDGHTACPLCREQLSDKSHICPHCYIPMIECPYCARRAGGLEDPKMVVEQRLNRILKQFTLFSPAMPSMPIQPILDCSECSSRIIICESCHTALKHTAQACPDCNNEVRRTKLLINPITFIETILNRPDALKGVQRLIEMLISQTGK